VPLPLLVRSPLPVMAAVSTVMLPVASITPAAVGPIKELVRKVDLAELTAAMTGWLADPGLDLRQQLAAWADEREIEYD